MGQFLDYFQNKKKNVKSIKKVVDIVRENR